MEEYRPSFLLTLFIISLFSHILVLTFTFLNIVYNFFFLLSLLLTMAAFI